MSPNRVIQFISLVSAATCMIGSALLGGPLHAQREDLKLAGTPAGSEGVPPGIMLTQAALGSFRGLAVDFLWHRATKLKEAGQYREANQLSQWICLLQPRFESVWVFHAWNMAYNISVATHTPEERWNWVNKGIRLLREAALPANPESVLLNKELSWIFFHKFGGVSDDMHWYYRKKLAAEWQEVLGSPEGFTTEEMIRRIKDIAEASDSLEELLEDEKTRRLVEQLRGLGYEPDECLMRQFGRIFMVEGSYDNFQFIGLDVGRLTSLLDIDPELYRFMGGPQQQEFTDAYRRLVHFLRKKILEGSYRMDPAEMVRMMTEYGPLDWRHPAAHGAYWAEQGIRAAERARVKTTIDQINTDRLIIHSMQELMRTGRLSFDRVSGYLDMLPDPRFVKSYEQALGFAKDRIKNDQFKQGTTDSYNSGYENFLLQATTFSYNYGDRKQAEEYFDRWRDKFRDEPHNAERRELTLERLVWHEMEENLVPMMSNTRQFIDARLRDAFLKGWAHGRNDLFKINYEYAKKLYDQHQKKYGQEYNANAKAPRLRLPRWLELFLSTYVTVVKDRRINLIARARIWRATPSPYRMPVYDALRPGLHSEALALGFNPERVLPEPEGMEEYRRMAEKRRKESEAISTPATVERR